MHRGDRLVCFLCHPKAKIQRGLSRTQRHVFFEIVPGCLNGGVCRPVCFIGLVQGNRAEEASQMSIRGMPYSDSLWLSVEPVSSELRRLFSLVLLNHFKDILLILSLHRLGQDAALELEKRADHRILAVQIHQIQQCALLRHAAALFDIGSVIGTGSLVQLAVPIGVAPVQVCHNRLTRKVMREKPFGAGLDKRQPSQPIEEFARPVRGSRAGCAHIEHLIQQGFRHHPRQRAGFEGGAMCRSRHLLDKSFQQSLDHIR